MISVTSKIFKNRLKIARNNYFKKIADEVNLAASVGNFREVWRLSDQNTNFLERQPEVIEKSIRPQIKSFYQNHFSKKHDLPTPPELNQPPPNLFLNLQIISGKIKQEPPDANEITLAILGLKNNKGALDFKRKF